MGEGRGVSKCNSNYSNWISPYKDVLNYILPNGNMAS